MWYSNNIMEKVPKFTALPTERRKIMPVPKANQRAVNKYKKNNYDRIEITVPKGQRDIFQAHAAAHGESTNAFIGRAIAETMERDSGIAPEIAGKPAETAQGAGAVSLPSDALEAAQRAAEAAGGGIPDKVAAAESLFRIMGNLGDVDLDESRGERLGIVHLPPDTLETAQRAAERTGETVADFVARAVSEQQGRDDRSFKMGINPA